MQEVRGNIAERVASAFNDRDPRMKRWACMSAERRRQYVLRWERRLQAIRDAGFEVVEAAEIERLAMDAKSLEGIIDSLERRVDGPDGLLAKVERLTRGRDEARAEVERLMKGLRQGSPIRYEPAAGCLCPVGANASCQNAFCPRRNPPGVTCGVGRS